MDLKRISLAQPANCTLTDNRPEIPEAAESRCAVGSALSTWPNSLRCVLIKCAMEIPIK